MGTHFLSVCVSVCVSVCHLTPPRRTGGSLRNFQGTKIPSLWVHISEISQKDHPVETLCKKTCQKKGQNATKMGIFNFWLFSRVTHIAKLHFFEERESRLAMGKFRLFLAQTGSGSDQFALKRDNADFSYPNFKTVQFGLFLTPNWER